MRIPKRIGATVVGLANCALAQAAVSQTSENFLLDESIFAPPVVEVRGPAVVTGGSLQQQQVFIAAGFAAPCTTSGYGAVTCGDDWRYSQAAQAPARVQIARDPGYFIASPQYQVVPTLPVYQQQNYYVPGGPYAAPIQAPLPQVYCPGGCTVPLTW